MYSICVLAGMIVSGLLIHLTIQKRKDISYIEIVNIPLFSVAGAFFGAKLLYALTRFEVIAKAFGSLPQWGKFFTLLGEAFGGMFFYGGLLGALAVGYGYCRIAKVDFLLYADVFAPAIPLFHAFGRVGCLMAGCCYGIEADWGIVYHSQWLEPSVNDVTRLPVQLIEAAGNLLIMLLLLYVGNRRLKKGTVLAMYFLLYPILRFTDEFFRGDTIRGHLLFLSTSQWISIVVLSGGIVMLLKRYAFPKTRDTYSIRVPTGEIPEGYVYNRYAGAVAPEDQYKLQGGNL